MVNDEFNPYRAPLSGEGTVPPRKSNPDSLKSLNAARNTLFAIGGLMVAAHIFLFTQIPRQVEKFLQQEIAAERANGFEIDPVLVEEERADRIQFARLVVAGAIGLGCVVVGLGMAVKKAPVPITIVGLVLYLALQAADLYFTGIEEGFKFPWLKILFIVLLFQAVGAAQAYERKRRREEMQQFSQESPAAF